MKRSKARVKKTPIIIQDVLQLNVHSYRIRLHSKETTI